MFDLTGKIALVSGGAKGIGKGIVSALKNSGAQVIIADIDDVAGNATKHLVLILCTLMSPLKQPVNK